MSRSWSVRYMWQKLNQAWDVHAAHVRKYMDKNASATSAYTFGQKHGEKSWEFTKRALFGPLTRVIRFTGPAMSPTLNRRSTGVSSGAYEFLLVREIPDPHQGNVQSGDIVCLRHPNGVTPDSILVRRVLATGGDTVQTPPDGTEQVVAPGMIWVQADTDDEKITVEDSSTFGAVPMGNVLGRCIYAFASEADQGFVENNEVWKSDDEEVVAIEFTDEVMESLESVKSALGQPHPGPGAEEADSARPKKTP
eukprot:jgi/Ulvmu1/2191/UM013_0037.1